MVVAVRRRVEENLTVESLITKLDASDPNHTVTFGKMCQANLVAQCGSMSYSTVGFSQLLSFELEA